jgi:large subunit ribosomal protein L10
MSKRVKSLIEKELAAKFRDVENVAVINPRGINATRNNEIRRKLRAGGARMTVVRNNLVKRAIGDGKLKGFEPLLDGPSALVYGQTSISAIARILIEERNADEKLELRGVFFDGELYLGQKGVEQVSKLPTRQEAIGLLVAAMLGPGKKLAAAVKGPGGTLGAVLKSTEDKAKEKGEAAPVAAAAEAAAAPAAPAAQ